tara:strand:- start:14036 stop:15793 length:1758 start_codon:yes stop_codon:yes gene_type:complete
MLHKIAAPFLFRDHKPRFKVRDNAGFNKRRLADGVAELALCANKRSFCFSYCNDELLKILSYRENTPLEKKLDELIWLQDHGQLQEQVNLVCRTQETQDFYWQYKTPDGQEYSLYCRLLPIKGLNGALQKVMLLSADKALELKFEQEVERYTYFDSLTNLPNKHYFYQVIEDRFGDDLPPGDAAVMFINIFKLQRINESYGYEAGDELLKMIAQKIQSCLPPEGLLARFDGDKFVILLNDEAYDSAENEAVALARQIHHELTKKIHLGNQKIQVAATIGISSGTSTLHNLIELLQNAHTAMQRINGLSTDRTLVYKPEIKSRAQSILKLETELGVAIDNRELEVYYQPIINLANGALIGFEALSRWNHPERGAVSPAEFIPLAEESGLILPIGRWCMTTACQQLSEWIKKYPEAGALMINVNVSNMQITQDDLMAVAREALRHSELEGHHLKLEITESSLVENADQTRDILLDLKSLGLQLAIDDFGTGYSSLSYLHRFPIDTLKIDRSFIMDMNRNEDSQKLVHIISNLAITLGLDLVAEGVERQEQLLILRQLGCHAGQGFFIAPPLPASEAENFIVGGRNFQ